MRRFLLKTIKLTRPDTTKAIEYYWDNQDEEEEEEEDKPLLDDLNEKEKELMIITARIKQNKIVDYYDNNIYVMLCSEEGETVADNYYQWRCKMVLTFKKININYTLAMEQLDNDRSRVIGDITSLKIEIRKIQQKYLTRYFDPKRFTGGTMIEYDYTGGLNSSGVNYVIVKATKTYLMGFSVIGVKCGEVKKITDTKTVMLIR
jgi:hypothetical protein